MTIEVTRLAGLSHGAEPQRLRIRVLYNTQALDQKYKHHHKHAH